MIKRIVKKGLKIIIKNKGVLIFYLIIILSTLLYIHRITELYN